MEKERLNWQNLKRNKCPKCNSNMNFIPDENRVFDCVNKICAFRISEERWSEVVIDMNKQSLERSHYQQSDEVEDLLK